MRWPVIIKINAVLILFLGVFLFFPVMVEAVFRDGSFKPLLLSVFLAFFTGGILYFITKKEKIDYLTPREGMAIVSIGWTVIGLVGALPFYFSGAFGSFVNAFFESVSGFTTTGSSILTNIESVSKSLLFWRSLIQWIGGMGIIVLSVAILPFLGVGGMQLYKAEVPSPVPDKLKPRIRDTAMILWKVYLGITLLQIFLLMIGGMDLFNAMCHAFTTMPTGGFSTKNLSIAHFDSTYFDIVFIVFMVLAGINFSLHYKLITGEKLIFWKDPECRFFLILFLVLTALVTFDIHGAVYKGIGESIRYASFQISSIITTTGYATADYEKWPAMSQLILLICMFIGASAGSTGGGMKCLRIMLCLKFCYKELFSLIHPRSVSHIKLGGKTVSDEIIRSIIGFLALYVLLAALFTVLVAATGVDFVTSIGAVAATIGNIGPGFGLVGPAENFALIPDTGKWLLILCMLLGRLEVYTVIILFVPEFWRK